MSQSESSPPTPMSEPIAWAVLDEGSGELVDVALLRPEEPEPGVRFEPLYYAVSETVDIFIRRVCRELSGLRSRFASCNEERERQHTRADEAERRIVAPVSAASSNDSVTLLRAAAEQCRHSAETMNEEFNIADTGLAAMAKRIEDFLASPSSERQLGDEIAAGVKYMAEHEENWSVRGLCEAMKGAPVSHEPALDALRELVACKDLKEQIEKMEGPSVAKSRMHQDYECRKEPAWKAARAALKNTPIAASATRTSEGEG